LAVRASLQSATTSWVLEEAETSFESWSFSLARHWPTETVAHDAKWGQFVIDPPFFTKLVYAGV
jgi:hypothetical protein